MPLRMKHPRHFPDDYSVKSGMELEGFDDDPDDDLVANATDRGEYLPFEANH
jgi:hypothetical protein